MKNIECFLLDLDGTVYLGNKLIDGAIQFLNFVKSSGKRYCFLTNNSSRSTKDYIVKLKSLGLNVCFEEVLTSGYVAARWLKDNYFDKKIYVLGTKSYYDELKEYGLKLNDKDADIVLISYDAELTYDKLCKACKFINEGAAYYCTHPDVNCPSEKGLLPDVGSYISLIKKSTGRIPQKIFGKPYNTIGQVVKDRFNLKNNQIAMVGDRLSTDIKFALNNKFMSILVLTGETDREMLQKSKIKPDIVIDSIKSIIDLKN